MNSPQTLFNTAFQLHQSGRVQEAIRLYCALLPQQKNNAHLLFLLGTANAQIGQIGIAQQHLKRSLALNPQNPFANHNHADVLLSLKRPDEALACCDKALTLKPDFAEAHNTRGRALQALKRPDEALTSYDQALSLRPDYAEAYYNRGVALQDLQREDEALASYDQALSLAPGMVQGHNNRGLALQELRRPDEALASYDKALSLDPGHIEALNNRGNALQDLKRLDEALACYDKVLSLKPDDAEAHYNRGTVLQDLGRPDAALASYDKALSLRPDYLEAYNNRGNVLQSLLRLDEARASFDKAQTLKPDHAEACWNKSLLLMLTGQYIEGWEQYEWRFKTRAMKHHYPDFSQPAWRGQDSLQGKTLLICAEQGFGDVIQFCRYLPQLSQLGARILFEVPKALESLVSTLNCPMTVVTKGSALPPFDAYCPVMSLPHAFKTTVETIPATVPYLGSERSKVEAWHKKLGEKTRLRIGVVWSGAAGHKNDANRSIRLEDFLPLTERPVEWHSLQKIYRPQDLDKLGLHPEIHQHQDDLNDFSDTAALIECMDLVICVDTSVAHVAGALGKPVWILLPFSPDFRWMLERDDTPWYPSARLFRQSGIGDWQSVIAQVGSELQKMSPQ
jgi:hypothetical protein